MSEIPALITHPLSLCGLALCLVFGLVARSWSAKRQRKQDRTVFNLAMALAVVGLLGGLALAYVDLSRQQPAAASGSSTEPSKVEKIEQNSEGDQSPNVISGGDVEINYGGSNGDDKKADSK